MSKLLEVINSLNDEQITPEAREALLAEGNALSKDNKQLYSRAKKAEGFEYDKTNNKWTKKEIKIEPKVELKPNEPDYATKLAIRTFLKQEGITHPDDQQWVQDEAKRLNRQPDEILAMEHVKSYLTTSNDQRIASEGMPKRSGQGGGKTQNDIDYWLDRKKPDGTYDTPADLTLANKVIDARIAKQKQVNQFSDTLFTG
jgi:hypothetical protein